MKKKLEADLISIAHRVLQMKNKSDINQLCIETQKLHEKLSILRFVEEHFEGAKPTIGQAEVVTKIKQFFEENHFSQVKPAMTKLDVVEENVEELIIEEEVAVQETDDDEIANEESPKAVEADFNEIEPDEEGEDQEISEDDKSEFKETEFRPAFELDNEEEMEVAKEKEAVQISFDDFFGGDYSDTLFVKLDTATETVETPIDFELPKVNKMEEDYKKELISENNEVKTVSLNDKLAKGISIDLNDRLAFVKHLFGNSDEDYNRVMNQLITYDSFEEAQNFIEDMVKPDYNNWEGKEDYVQRFIEIIEKKFS